MSDKKNKKTAMCTHECEPEESGRSAQAKAKTRRRVRTALMSTVIALSASAIAALSVALYYSETRNATQESYIRSMEAVYSRSYYDLLDSANDLDLRLAKLRAASTAEAQRDLLYGVWQTATSASASLAAFEGGTEGIMKANKFLGQVGDYARCLAEEMGDGEPLTAEALSDMYYALNKKYYGRAVRHNDLIRYEWARIPHFFSSFYVYKYATGLTAAVTIADNILKGGEKYFTKYRDFLSAGGSLPPLDILRLADVDLETDEPYERAMKEFADTLSEFEKCTVGKK